MESALRTSSVSTFLAVHAHNYIIHRAAPPIRTGT